MLQVPGPGMGVWSDRAIQIGGHKKGEAHQLWQNQTVDQRAINGWADGRQSAGLSPVRLGRQIPCSIISGEHEKKMAVLAPMAPQRQARPFIRSAGLNRMSLKTSENCPKGQPRTALRNLETLRSTIPCQADSDAWKIPALNRRGPPISGDSR
jgi:hypothetical protein